MIITLNRPEKRNALSFQMCHTINEAVEDAALDKNIRIVVIRGEGQSFCAGIDLNSLAEINSQFTTTAEFRFSVSKAQDAFNKMEKMEKPVIALLHGHCFGLGLELALAADFRIEFRPDLTGPLTAHLRLCGVAAAAGDQNLPRFIENHHLQDIILPQHRLDRTLQKIGILTENPQPDIIGQQTGNGPALFDHRRGNRLLPTMDKEGVKQEDKGDHHRQQADKDPGRKTAP